MSELAEVSGLDPFSAQFKTPRLRVLYALWLEHRGPSGLGDTAILDLPFGERAEWMFLVEVHGAEGSPRFEFRGLSASRQEWVDELHQAEGALGSLEGAYREVIEKKRPAYEYARFGFGDGPPVLFERLLLPLSIDGDIVTHLLGAVLMGDMGY